MDRIDSQNDVFCQMNDSWFRVEVESVQGAANRFSKVGDIFILSDL